jgi:hypothetical protein
MSVNETSMKGEAALVMPVRSVRADVGCVCLLCAALSGVDVNGRRAAGRGHAPAVDAITILPV